MVWLKSELWENRAGAPCVFTGTSFWPTRTPDTTLLKIKENNCLNSFVFAIVLCQVAHFSHSLQLDCFTLSPAFFRSGARTRTGHQETVQATVFQLGQCCHRPCSPKICCGTTGPLHKNDSTQVRHRLFASLKTAWRRRWVPVKAQVGKNCSLKTAWRRRWAPVNAQVGQKLLPKRLLAGRGGGAEKPQICRQPVLETPNLSKN